VVTNLNGIIPWYGIVTGQSQGVRQSPEGHVPMTSSPRLRWHVGFLIATLVVVVPSVFLEGHFFGGVAFSKLVGPAFVLGSLFLISAPFFYWGRSYAIAEKRDYRRLCLVAAFFVATFCLLTVFYAARLGIVSPKTARGLAAGTLIMTPPGFVGAYFVHKLFFIGIRQA
jgi:hypothetical protein